MAPPPERQREVSSDVSCRSFTAFLYCSARFLVTSPKRTGSASADVVPLPTQTPLPTQEAEEVQGATQEAEEEEDELELEPPNPNCNCCGMLDGFAFE